ncbi:DNA-binding transcriptional regulator, MocR family, contains an aminotransferase domain [Paraburkholderia susongensis]|uniref:DNA-binding transcriptional regulator, MocR family, contains an aminotransferase domain n=2 Tax=Paraburkholderia susongensis TaxID=1515439 RepID=A0A1X7HWK6_9BURK|nr:DNA-binding transcriptional regulator, MocR family, contains an aminotransferase domain [Paraburkholderia susongensis]
MTLHRVSISTAVEACRVLEKLGYVEAKPRVGYFVRGPMQAQSRVRGVLEKDAHETGQRIDPADYVGVHERISVTLARGLQNPLKVDLAGAVCAPALYPGAALRDNMLRILRARSSLYDSAPRPDGVRKLKEAISRFSVSRGMHVDSDAILVTHGCSEALSLALRAVAGPGDVIAIESPTYFGILQVIESLGLKAIEIPTHPHTGISVDALEFAITHMGSIQAVVCMPSVQNPLGSVMPDAMKAKLAELCEKHDIAVIEDDTYGAFLPSPANSKPVKAWDKSGNVIYCSSLNKSLSPGLRVGWLIGGKWHKKIEMLMYAVSRHREEMSQLVVADFMAGSAFHRHMRRLNALLTQQRTQFVEAILKHFPAGTEVTRPEAGLLVWIRLPGELNADRLFESALCEGIRICPGSIFSNTNKFTDCLRLSYGMPFDARIESALKALARLARET